MNGLKVTHTAVIASAVLPLAWRIVGVGDVDGDRKCDLVWRQIQTGDVAVWLMAGATVELSVSGVSFLLLGPATTLVIQ